MCARYRCIIRVSEWDDETLKALTGKKGTEPDQYDAFKIHCEHIGVSSIIWPYWQLEKRLINYNLPCWGSNFCYLPIFQVRAINRSVTSQIGSWERVGSWLPIGTTIAPICHRLLCSLPVCFVLRLQVLPLILKLSSCLNRVHKSLILVHHAIFHWWIRVLTASLSTRFRTLRQRASLRTCFHPLWPLFSLTLFLKAVRAALLLTRPTRSNFVLTHTINRPLPRLVHHQFNIPCSIHLTIDLHCFLLRNTDVFLHFNIAAFVWGFICKLWSNWFCRLDVLNGFLEL